MTALPSAKLPHDRQSLLRFILVGGLAAAAYSFVTAALVAMKRPH